MAKNFLLNEEEEIELFEFINKSQILTSDNLSYSLSISLTDKCNLNCTNCQTFCDIQKSNPNFTTLEDLENTIPIILKKLKNFECSGIVLFGGEPLLNPQIKDICKYLRKITNIPITIFSNGLLFNTWTDKDFLMLKNLNIKILVTVYPIEEQIYSTQRLEEKCKNFNIDFNTHGIRPYFMKSSFNTKGNPITYKQKYYYCSHSQLISLYLHKNKLYKCGVCPNYEKIHIPESKGDYLTIDNDFSEEKFKNYLTTPLDACKYCGEFCDPNDRYSSDEIFIWHQQSLLPSEYKMTLLNCYLDNYELYYKYCHDCKHLIKILQNKYFISKNDPSLFSKDYLQMYQTRFFNGIGDICIPFDKKIFNFQQMILLQNGLIKQNNFELFNIYFISTDKDRSAKKQMYKIFTPTSSSINGNFYFLQSNSDLNQELLNTFFNNSFLNKKLLLNISERNIKDIGNDRNYFIKKFSKIKEDNIFEAI